MSIIGRNQNTNDIAVVTTYTVNSTTATTISAVNLDRISFEVHLDPDSTDVEVLVRLYPAADDNLKRGNALVRDTFGAYSLFKPDWRMQSDNMYTGEISAISVSGNVDIHVTEY
jgi:hypothetical protein